MANQRAGELQPWDTIRVPFISSQTSRIVDQSTSTSAAIGGIGIAGIAIAGKGLPGQKDQKLVNFMPEAVENSITKQKIIYTTKRPGVVTNTTPAAGSVGQAVRLWLGEGSNKIISAFGATNSTIYDGTSSLGAITGLATDITETFVGTTATLVIPSTDNTAWYFPKAGALTKIADADFPGNNSKTLAGTFVHIDGYSFIMDTTGTIWNSDLNSITAWTSTSFIGTNISPDLGVGLARYKNYLLAFGKESIEFFQNAGNSPGSPLTRLDQAFIKVGAVNAACIINVEDTVIWAASSEKGGIAVFALDNFQPKKISTANIELQLSQISTTNLSMTTARIRGKTYVFMNSPDSIYPTSYVYAMEDQQWHQWQSDKIYWHRMTGETGGTLKVYTVSNVSTSGMVYKIDPSTPAYSDNGYLYPASVQTGLIDAETENFKRCHKAKIIGDISESTSYMTISWTDNDYQSYKGGAQVDLSQGRAFVSNLGSFRRRAFKLDHISAVACRMEALELDISLGIH